MTKVMIVDDDDFEREGLRHRVNWANLGAQVFCTCSNGSQALYTLKNNPCDLVLTDIKMPVMDGIQLADEIKNHFPDTAVVYITSYDYFEYAQAAVTNNVKSYILKPYDIDEVEQKLQGIIVRINQEKNKKQQVEIIQKKYLQSLPYIKGHLFSELISGKLNRDDEIDRRLVFVEAGFCSHSRFACVLAKTVNKPQGQPVKVSLKSILYSKISFCYFNSLCLPLGENDFLFLLQTDEDINGMKRKFTAIKDEIQTRYGFRMAIGISNVLSGLSKTPDACRQCREAVEYEIRCQTGQVVLYRNISVNPASGRQNEAGLKQSILSCIALGNAEEVKKQIGILFDLFRGQLSEMAYVQNVCISLVNEMQNIMQINGINPKNIFCGDANLISQLLSCGLISDIQRWMLDVSGDISNAVRHKKDGSSKLVVESIIKRIDDNYNRDISIPELLSDSAVSIGYASVLFKKATGLSIQDYIIQKRIDHAKYLLINTKERINKIAKDTGYHSLSYFGLSFKSVEGISPSEFRSRMLQTAAGSHSRPGGKPT